MAKLHAAKTSTGLIVTVKKDFYTWLWNVCYEDGMKYAGPFKTMKEAIDALPKAEREG